MHLHDDLITLAKIFTVAFAVGLDVLAVSIGVGVARIAWDATVRLGLAFAGSELAMQLIGYEVGSRAGQLMGEFAAYLGFVVLAIIGLLMVRSSFRHHDDPHFDPTRGAGLVTTSLSISLDSLGVGIALPAAAIPLLPLLTMLSITTTVFTFVGLEFGARLGERYEHRAELLAGSILIVLAALFAIERSL